MWACHWETMGTTWMDKMYSPPKKGACSYFAPCCIGTTMRIHSYYWKDSIGSHKSMMNTSSCKNSLELWKTSLYTCLWKEWTFEPHILRDLHIHTKQKWSKSMKHLTFYQWYFWNSVVYSITTFGWRKIKTCQFGSAKWFWPSIYPKCWWGLPKVQQSLTPAVDWLDSLIGPRWVAMSSFRPFAESQFQCYGWC